MRKTTDPYMGVGVEQATQLLINEYGYTQARVDEIIDVPLFAYRVHQADMEQARIQAKEILDKV